MKSSKKGTVASWLNARIGSALLVCVLALAGLMRLYHINTLPPGLHPSEAHWIRLGLEFSRQHSIALLLKPGNLPFSLFILLQAAVVSLTKSMFVLKCVNALLGVLSVAGLYMWAKQWFGRRAALLTAFFAAVSPWFVTLNRNVWPINLSLVIFVWLMVLITKAYRTRKLGYSLGSLVLLLIGLFSSRLFLVVPVLLLVCLVIEALRKGLGSVVRREVLVAAIVGAIMIIPFVTVLFVSQEKSALGIRAKFVGADKAASVMTNARSVLDNAGKTGLMFFVAGDDDYTRNLAGLPLLDSFVGLMLLLGLLVAMSRIRQARYDFLVVGFLLSLVPAVFVASQSIPDSYHAAISLPVIFLLSGVGVNYMITRWYSMFPVNTTARNLGLSFILVLLFLSGYLGYRQYFVAWAQDPKTYATYREDLLESAKFIKANGGAKGIYVVADDQSLASVSVLLNQPNIVFDGGSIGLLNSLPLTSTPRIVIIPETLQSKDQKAQLVTKFPKGTFYVKRSSFDDRILFSWYEVK